MYTHTQHAHIQSYITVRNVVYSAPTPSSGLLTKTTKHNSRQPEYAYHSFHRFLIVAASKEFRLSSGSSATKQDPGRPWHNQEAEKVIKAARIAFDESRKDPLST